MCDAERVPVFVTDHGHPSFVPVSIEHLRLLSGERSNSVEMLAMSTELDPEPTLLDQQEIGKRRRVD